MRPEYRVEFVQHNARLDADPALLDVQIQDAIVILRDVEHQAGADGLTSLRSAATAHRDRAAKRPADPDGANQILPRLHNGHAERFDLVHTGVRRVERTRDFVEADLAFQAPLQLSLKRADVHAAWVSLRQWDVRGDRDEVHREARPWRSLSRPRARFSPPLAKETRSVPSPDSP